MLGTASKALVRGVDAERGAGMREQLVAWAGDCVVRGDVELGDGRLSDRVNELDLLTFHDATLRALDDGREVHMDELQVERHELHVIEVNGRRGDPERRLRTVRDRVVLRVGPFTISGSLHRPASAQPLAAVSGWMRFVPVTDAVVAIEGEAEAQEPRDVVLVNRERIARADVLDEIVVYPSEEWPPLPTEDVPAR